MPTIETGRCKSNGDVQTAVRAGSLVLEAHRLPNPYRAIKEGRIEETPGAIRDWLRTKSGATRKKFDALVDSACKELSKGRDVRIECSYGRHRSQVVAAAVMENIQGGVNWVVWDAPRLVPLDQGRIDNTPLVDQP